MSKPGPGYCKGCRAAIVWITTTAGKAMICDPDPIPLRPDPSQKTVGVTEDGRTLRGFTTPAMRFDEEGVERVYSPHWWTCPARDQFKRSKEK